MKCNPVSGEELRSLILEGHIPQGLDLSRDAAHITTALFYAAMQASNMQPPILNQEGAAIRKPLDLSILARQTLHRALEHTTAAH